MVRILVRPRAQREIDAILVYYIENAGLEVARQFRRAAMDRFSGSRKCQARELLARFASLNSKDVRMWHIEGFENYLYFLLSSIGWRRRGARNSCFTRLSPAAAVSIEL